MAAPPPNGMYVVTQYIPAVNVNNVQQRTGPCQTPHFLQRFIKGEPKALGAIQVLNGLLHICLGGILCSFEQTGGSIIVFSGVPFWAAVFGWFGGTNPVLAARLYTMICGGESPLDRV